MTFKGLTTICSLLVLLLIISIGCFPKIFTTIQPNEVTFKKIPPNKGTNLIEIANKQNQLIEIYEVKFVFNNKTLILLENFELADNESKTIILEGQEIVGTRTFQGVLSTNSYLYQPFVFKINNREIEVTYSPRRNHHETRNMVVEESNLMVKSFFGTDSFGRDIWTRFVYATGVMLKICLFSFIVSVPIGVLFGLIHGYSKFLLEFLLDGFTGLFNVFPIYLVAMFFIGAFGQEGQKFYLMVLIFSAVQWIEIEKIIYEEVRKHRKKDFVKSARLFGRPSYKILFNDILILCVPNITIGGIFFLKRMIMVESALSYLGYSVTVPHATWGNIMMGIHLDIFKPITDWWWIILLPSLAILATSLSLNVLEIRLKERTGVRN